MESEGMRRSEFAVASLVVGIVSFVQLFNIEKPIVAVIFGILALKRITRDNQLGGKKLALAGIILGVIGIVATTVFTAMVWPQLQQMGQKVQ